jgi:hypothetical protein
MNGIIFAVATSLCFALPLFAPSVLRIVLLLGCIIQPLLAERMRIEATLDSPITNVKGFTWLVEEGGVVNDTFVSQDPSDVRVTFPSGRVWKTGSRFTIVDQRNKLVYRLVITPCDEAMRYADCIKRVEKVLGEVGVESSSPLFQKVEGWKSVPDQEQRVVCTVEEGIELYIDIKRAIYQDQNDPAQWFVSCEFEVTHLYLD